MKVDRYVDLTFALEVALAVAGGMAGGYAWTPSIAGALVGGILGYVVGWVLVETLDRLFVIYSDPDRLARELAKGRHDREQGRRKKK